MNPLLGRWISADPLAVHAPGSADLNLYAYVHGEVLKNVDPLGLMSEKDKAQSDAYAAQKAEGMSEIESLSDEETMLQLEIDEKSYLAETEAVDQDDFDTREAQINELKGQLYSTTEKRLQLEAHWEKMDRVYQEWFDYVTAPQLTSTTDLFKHQYGDQQSVRGKIVQRSDLPQVQAREEGLAIQGALGTHVNAGPIGVPAGVVGGVLSASEEGGSYAEGAQTWTKLAEPLDKAAEVTGGRIAATHGALDTRTWGTSTAPPTAVEKGNRAAGRIDPYLGPLPPKPVPPK